MVVDASVPEQEYIEDCSVCCRPIRLAVSIDNSENIIITASREDDC
jgi:hypothetical protein